MLELIHEDAEWRPYRMAREVYIGHAAIREYFDELAERISSATATEYAFREVGDAVVVSGSLQVVEASGGMAQHQVHWVYRVRDGKIVFAASFARREQALAAAGAT
jgi:ketosteroid isomerase-like protein